MFFGFHIESLQNLNLSRGDCPLCGAQEIIADFLLIHSFYKSKSIFRFRDMYCQTVIESFTDAVRYMLEDKKDCHFMLTINDTTFPPMTLEKLPKFLIKNLKSTDMDERLDFSEPHFHFDIHLSQ